MLKAMRANYLTRAKTPTTIEIKTCCHSDNNLINNLIVLSIRFIDGKKVLDKKKTDN